MKIFSFLSIGQVIVKLCLIGYLGRFRFQKKGWIKFILDWSIASIEPDFFYPIGEKWQS